MGRKLAIPVLLVAALLVTAAGVDAITFGVPDEGEHPYVGLLYFEVESGISRCSGTLMSRTVFLTAGHCTAEGGQPASRAWVTFDEQVNIPQEVLDLPDDEFADWLDTQPTFIRAQEAIPHPLFNDFAEFPATYDVGVVLLPRVNMSQYGWLPPQDYLERFTKGKRHKRDNFEVVGYGDQGFIKPFARVESARFKGQASLIELNSTFDDGMTAKFTNNRGRGNGAGGTCFGDSGGPVFKNNTNVVVAVVSWGITPCIGVDYQFRTDTALALDFLSDYLP